MRKSLNAPWNSQKYQQWANEIHWYQSLQIFLSEHLCIHKCAYLINRNSCSHTFSSSFPDLSSSRIIDPNEPLLFPNVHLSFIMKQNQNTSLSQLIELPEVESTLSDKGVVIKCQLNLACSFVRKTQTIHITSQRRFRMDRKI